MDTRSTQTPRISCVMPAFNEGPSLGTVLPQLLDTLRPLGAPLEVLVVDDGSRDDTAAVMEQLCARHPELVYLQLSRNFGKEAALTAGLDAASGDVVVLLDADGQHPVALIPAMLRKWQDGFDVVYAVRSTRDDQSALQARLTGVFYQLINWGGRVKIPRDAGDFRLMDRKAVEALKALPERNRFMKGLYAWVGFGSTALAYEPLPRTEGRSKFGFRGSFALALTGLTAFSTVPLRLMTWLGLAMSATALGYGAWVVFEHYFFDTQIPGYATTVVSTLLFDGIQMLAMGILAEYLGRIYEEVKRRPTYFIARQSGQGLPK